MRFKTPRALGLRLGRHPLRAAPGGGGPSALPPFGFSLSPRCYHTLREAKAAYLCSKGIPTLAYLDDS